MQRTPDKLKICELYESIPKRVEKLFEGVKYPWEVLERLKDILSYVDTSGLEEISDGVFVGKDVNISALSTLIGPSVICDGCEIRPGAYIRGRVFVGEGSVIGNSTELKNAVLLTNATLPHYNYAGDSVIGNHAHMGAGAIISNLKSLGTNVCVKGERIYETGLRKLGACLGDYADIGAGAVLNPGTVIGKRTVVYPLVRVRGVVAENKIYKGEGIIVERNP